MLELEQRIQRPEPDVDEHVQQKLTTASEDQRNRGVRAPVRVKVQTDVAARVLVKVAWPGGVVPVDPEQKLGLRVRAQ
jgi:hypothetical protein